MGARPPSARPVNGGGSESAPPTPLMADCAYEVVEVEVDGNRGAMPIRQMRFAQWNGACAADRSADHDMTGACRQRTLHWPLG